MRKLAAYAFLVFFLNIGFTRILCLIDPWTYVFNKILNSNNSVQITSEFVSLVEQYPDSLNNKDSLGDTLLHRAIKNGKGFLIWFLLEKRFDIDVNVQNNFGLRALDLALDIYSKPDYEFSAETDMERTNWFIVIRKLVSRGANWSLKNHHLSTPMHFVIENRLHEIKKLFMNSVKDKNELLKRLNVVDMEGKTPIDLDAGLLEFFNETKIIKKNYIKSFLSNCWLTNFNETKNKR